MTKESSFEEISLNDFNASKYSHIYKLNKSDNTIELVKDALEMPSIRNTSGYNGNRIVKPSWNTYELEWMLKNNHTHRRCYELKATLITGFGYEFRNKNDNNYDKLVEFVKSPNSIFGQSFKQIMVNTYRNYCAYGSAPLFINKALDKIQIFDSSNAKSIFIVPKTIGGRQTTKIDKYIQVINGGETQEFLPYDGNPLIGKNYIYRYGYKMLSDSYYPDPVYLAAKDKIYEDIYVDKRNIDFFMNRAMGDYVMIVSDGRLNKKSKEKAIETYKQNMQDFKGANNQHKTMVLEAGKDSKIQLIDLSKSEDGQFSVRQNSLEYSIAKAWGITPSLLSLSSGGSGMGGGSVAIGDLFLENQIMIRPEQEDFEDYINILLESLFGFNPEIKFKSIDTNNQKDMAIILSQLISSGTPISKIDARNYIMNHGLMEISDPEVIPDEADCVTPIKASGTNSDGDSLGAGDTVAEPDDITAISEDKFSE